MDQIKSPLFTLASDPLTALPLITMATTPEEFFGKGLMEQPPPSPPIFPDDLPQKPNGSSEGWHHAPNEMILSYVSHVLMDDDIDEQLNDHPALLQVQQPFAQILSPPSSGTNTSSREGSKDFLHEGNVDESELLQVLQPSAQIFTSPSSGTNTGSREASNDSLHEGNVDQRELNSTLSKGIDAVAAFLEGMERANRLLPKHNIRRDELVNHRARESSNHRGAKKRHSRDDHLQMEMEITRTSKAMTMTKEQEENNSANEMLDKMMLHGYEACIRGMDKLCVTMDSEVEKKNMSSGCSKGMRDNNVVDIRRLMISCAQEVAVNNQSRARELLKQIMQHASETGDATQRLAQCFTMGLEARLVGTGSLHWELLIAERPSVVEFLKAASLYYEACCFNKVALLFSEMTIMQAMVGKSRLHNVDYGMQLAYQWAGLLQLLASRKGCLPEVKITAIGLPKPKSYPTEKIEEIGWRLGRCAHLFGLPSFKFHAIKKNWEDACIDDLHIEADEVLVVSDHYSFGTLMDECISFDELNPRDIVLSNISKMRPHVFIQSIYNCSYGSSFLSQFREMLMYYTALFDIFDATIPRESQSRIVLEQVVLGRSALNALSCEGADLVERPERYMQWQTRNQRAGLRQLPLNTSTVEEVKDMVVKHHHKDFLVSQDGQWLL